MTRVLYASVSADWHQRLAGAIEGAGYADAGVARDEQEARAACAESPADVFVVGRDGDDDGALSLALARARHRQYRGLQDALARRAVVERAKGILMERQGIEEHEAFQLLREHARSHSRRVADVAESVLDSHRLLQPPPPA